MANIQLKKKQFIHAIVQGESSELLYSQLYPKKLSKDERNELERSSLEILSKCVPPKLLIPSRNNNTGIVIGYIQSGKTMSFTSVIALARDNGYKIVVVISGRTKLLLDQTIDRLDDDLVLNDDNILILSSPNINDFETVKDVLNNDKRNKTLIVPVLKQQNRIRNLTRLFRHPDLQNHLEKQTVIIIDDESDQASLNTNERSNARFNLSAESAIFSSIKGLRHSLPNHSYIQYTATPQANLLTSYLSLLSPDWHVLLTPGNNYTGGKIFFNDSNQLVEEIKNEGQFTPPNFTKLKSYPESLYNSIIEYLIVSSIICYSSADNMKISKKSSMLIHPTWKVDKGIKKFYDWTVGIIKGLKNDLKEENIADFKKVYKLLEAHFKKRDKLIPAFEHLIDIIENDILNASLKVHCVTGGYLENNQKFPWKNYKHHILVGGQLLDRGFTVEDLVTTYMPRDSAGINQADTIQQRCRFFGYKKSYIDYCKVYLTAGLIDDFKDYVQHEENLHDFLKNHSLQEFKKHKSPMLLSDNLRPTNLSRIAQDIVTHHLKGFHHFEPSYPYIEQNNALTTNFLIDIKNCFKGELFPHVKKDKTDNTTHNVYKVSIDIFMNFLDDFEMNNPYEQMKKMTIYKYLDYLKTEFEQDELWVIEMSPNLPQGRTRSINMDFDKEKMLEYKTADSIVRKIKASIAAEKGKNDPAKEAWIAMMDEHAENKYVISQIASGYPAYFSDRKLLKSTDSNFGYNNEVIVQIHKIFAGLKTPKYVEFKDKSFYTLAFNFSDEYAQRYINLDTN
jgi:hypothetical protein